MWCDLLTGAFIGTSVFTLYVTFSPGTKGFTFRPDEEGETRFTPYNLIRLMGSPFYDSNFWKLELLGINYVVYVVAATTIFVTTRRIILPFING